MKKLYFVLIGFLVFGGVEAQIINIPDVNFKAKLLSATSGGNSIASTQTPLYAAYNSSYYVSSYNQIDTNNDGEIQISEALAIKYLNINLSGISNLQGIEYFTNLNYLSCSSNQITSLDASVLTNLIYLSCSQNQLPSINVNGLTNLFGLDCSNNHISSLNVSGLVNLQQLYCGGNQITNLDLQGLTILNSLICNQNQLTSLNVSGSTNLTYLSCVENQITSLNISGLTSLKYLSCSYNQITSLNLIGFINLQMLLCTNNQLTSLDLDVSINSNFISLYCQSNQLTSLDVSKLTNISTVFCQNNQLTNLNLKNGHVINSLNFSANPNLQYICADDNQISSIQNKITSYGYTNCQLNTYCSFAPGGTFYTIQGSNKFDSNYNGCDASDSNLPNLKFNLTNGTVSGSSISDASGNYLIPVVSGTHTMVPILENPTYFNVSPTTATVTFPSATSPYIQDFCITANGSHDDLEVVILPMGRARPGFDANYKIIYKNKGTRIQNNSAIFLEFNDANLDLVSATPSISSQTTNSLTWNYTNLLPFETREIFFTMNVNSPTETPAVNAGDVLIFTATAWATAFEETMNDNVSTLNQIVVNAFDPNYKTCTEGTTIAPSEVGKYVHYIIGFENDGTANAENIVVKDMIDTTKYDITTLIPIKGSAPFTTRISNINQVEFIFQNINLPFASGSNQGYVAFKIKTKPTLVLGDTFSNTANIYFDYNAPIVTNTATTTIAALVNPEFVFSDYFTLSPIPTKGVLNINTKQDIAISSISIYNTLGQVVLVTSNPSNTIDVSNLTTGSYFIKVITDKGSSSGKFIKE